MKDFFKEYGTTQEEIINAMSEALEIIDLYTESNPDPYTGTADRLFEAIQILRQEWNMEE